MEPEKAPAVAVTDGLTPTERAAIRWRGADARRTGRLREVERCRGHRVVAGARVAVLDTVWRVTRGGSTTWWVIVGACGAQPPDGILCFPTRPEAIAAWRVVVEDRDAQPR